MKLDRSRPFAQTIGDSLARYHQDGKDFDGQGNELGAIVIVDLPVDYYETDAVAEPVKRKPGRPAKVAE